MIVYLIKKCIKKHLSVVTKYVESNEISRIVTSVLWDGKIISQYVQDLK